MPIAHIDGAAAKRAAWWPWYVPRIYLWIALNVPHKTEPEAWRMAVRVFHGWVWGVERLPWR